MHLRQRRAGAVASLFAVLVLWCACKKTTNSGATSTWFDKNIACTYNYTDDSGTTASFRKLQVIHGEGAGELFFFETPVDTTLQSWTGYFAIFGNGSVFKRADGLYKRACTGCSMAFCFGTFDYLFLPAAPRTGDTISQFGCAHSDDGQIVILNADTTITTPAGSFKTFYVRHPDRDRSYWNLNTGLVRYEVYEHGSAAPDRRRATLSLQRIDIGN